MKGKSHLILAIFLVFIMALSGCGGGGGDGDSSGETPEDTSGGNGGNNGGNDNGNLTISNHLTALKWENVSTPHIKVNWYKASGTYDSRYNPDSEDICAECTTGNDGSIWRLPTNNELSGLIDTNNLPAIKDGFNCEEARYWASSSVSEGGSASVIDFEDGRAKTDPKTQENYVRCVQPILKTVKGTISSSSEDLYIRIGDLWTHPVGGRYIFENVRICQGNQRITVDPYGSSWGMYYVGTIEITSSDTLIHDIWMNR